MIYIFGSREDHWLAFVDALKHLGFEVEFAEELDPRLYKDEDVWLTQYYKVFRSIEHLWHKIKMPKKFIMFPLNSVKDMTEAQIQKQYELDEKCGVWRNASLVFAFDQGDIAYFNKLFNVPYEKCHAIPFGYSPFYETYFPPAKNMPKIYDILFYGAYSDKRLEYIEYLRKLGLTVQWCGENPDTSPPVHGEERSEFIARATISIHIHKVDPLIMGNVFTRLSYLITHKIFLISEENPSSVEMEDLKQVIPMFSSKKDMGNLCFKWLLATEKERQAVADQAYNYLKTNYHLYDRIPVKQLQKLCAKRL